MRTKRDFLNKIGLVAVIGWVIFMGIVLKIKARDIPEEPKCIVELSNPSSEVFSEKAFDNSLLLYKIQYPDIVKKQALIETGYFTSSLFKDNNNLFGMQMPSRRATTAMYSKNGYAYYTHWIYSVIDYKLWQDYYDTYDLSHQEYLLLLSRVYAEDPNYILKINSL